ncbi:MAG: hypothetical protein HZA66_23740 [Rhodopseudomonas palustris]|uniref:Uncharacterized protein n=1 Tax=Rhodopseudomonas palustris TaxID=1076 RepID=A0A933S2H5_RHOPL|nr:hypothetical protein [Rhodopseudomonas palustris]
MMIPSAVRQLLLPALLVVIASAASAAEPSGCAAFKWPVDRERAMLTAPDVTRLDTGAELAAPPTTAMKLVLRPTAEAALPTPPERGSATDRFAGFLRIEKIAKPGNYTIALSSAGWLDVVQDGKLLKPTAFSGATDCAGIRKLVRYELGAGKLLLQISGVDSDAIVLAILPVD